MIKKNPVWTSSVMLNWPIEKEQHDESRQVGFRDVSLLLEGDEDQHHHGGRDAVVQLVKEFDIKSSNTQSLWLIEGEASSTVWRTDHVPHKVGQPVEDGFDAADKLQVFGFAGSLLDQEEDEAGRHEGHGEDHADGDQNVHWCGHPVVEENR